MAYFFVGSCVGKGVLELSPGGGGAAAVVRERGVFQRQERLPRFLRRRRHPPGGTSRLSGTLLICSTLFCLVWLCGVAFLVFGFPSRVVFFFLSLSGRGCFWVINVEASVVQ